MDLTSYYEGARLLSISYCERKIEEFNSALFDSGYKGFSEDDERVKYPKQQISKYTNMLSKLRSYLGKLDADGLCNVIIEEVAKKSKKCGGSKLLVTFSYVDVCTMEILVGNIFSTEISSSKQLYEKSKLLNKFYEPTQCTSRVYLTQMGKDIIFKIERGLCKKLPNVHFEFRYLNS